MARRTRPRAGSDKDKSKVLRVRDDSEARTNTDQPHSEILIDTYDQLLEAEDEILRRIADVTNGGNLFMAHPLLFLTEIGVVLSTEVQAEILRLHPELSGLSPTPYHALKVSTEKQSVRFHVRGLFRKRER